MKVFLTVLLSTWMTATAWAATPATAGVQRAHQAYLDGNGKVLLSEIKFVLEQNPNPSVQKNMLDLFSAAQKNKVFNATEPNWHLPKEITYAGVESLRRYRLESGKVVYSMNLSVDVVNGAELEQLQLIRYPNQVVLDKNANVGDWTSSVNTDGQAVNNWASTPTSISPNDEGLYLLNIQIKGQPAVQGWFILANKNASANPVVLAPKMNQVFSDNQPLFRWNQYLSPEFKPGESVRVGLRISQAGGDEPGVAQIRLKDPKAAFYKYGDRGVTDDFRGPTSLVPGDYQFHITYREAEKFGDLQIRRSSSTKIPFSVKP
jgi:hypothetical protein